MPQSQKTLLRLVTLAVLAAAGSTLWPLCARAAEQSSDGRFLAGLRERGLFELAETYCLDELADSTLPEVRRAELVVELSLSLSDQAVNSPPDERPPLWAEAVQVAEQFSQQYPNSPRLPLVRFQGALALVARGELAREESELVADNQTLVEEARTQLREAIRQIEPLADDVAARLREAALPGRLGAAGRDADRLTEYELASLQKNVQYQLARALRNQAQCYPAESPDRANSLTRALSLLDPLAELDATHPLAFKSRLDEIDCYRLLGDTATAARKLDALAAENPPPAVALRARAERIRLALAAGELRQAIALVDRGRTLGGTSSPQLDFAALRTYLEAWQQASRSGDQPSAAAWQSKATEMVRLIEEQHGPYWTRRSEMLLAGYVRTSSGGGGLEMQIRAAESSFRSGRPDDAVAAYDAAREMAQKEGDPARAFELGFTAATIRHQQDRHTDAMARYRRLAIDNPGNPKAAEAHLLAIYHAEQIARSLAPDAIQQYVELLEEHLVHWSSGPTADEVRWRLGRLREHQQDWQNAIAAYRGISPTFGRFAEVVEAAGRCYRAWLDQRAAAGQSNEAATAEAAEWFESIVLGPDGQLPKTWTPAARSAALEAARLWLDDTTSGYSRAERILSAALQNSGSDATPEWTSAARAMLVVSLAGQGRRDEAAKTLKQLSAGPPGELLGMLEGLLRAGKGDRSNLCEAPSGPFRQIGPVPFSEAKAEWATLALSAVDLLDARRGELAPGDQQKLDRLKAQALSEAGRSDEALAAYQWLAKVYPRDGDIQEAYARSLSARQDRASLEAALAKWREIDGGSRPGSDRWFRAKYEVASLHCRLGNPAQAEKMIKLLQVLHPDLGGPAMKARFLDLLDRAGKSRQGDQPSAAHAEPPTGSAR